MLVCPVCNYNHQEEESKCQRCDWSMQDNLDSIEINSEHPIFTTCIPTLVERLETETTHKEKLQLIIQQLELQESNSHKLDEILDQIEANKQQNHQEINTLKDQIVELKSLLKSKNNNSDIEAEETNNLTIYEHIQTSSPLENALVNFDSGNFSNVEYNENSSVFPTEGDRNINNKYALTDNYRKSSLYNETSDREPYENFDVQENIEPEANSNNSYENFYCLIEKRELEYIEASVTKESIEKLRGGTLSELKFSNYPRGNYWIINWKKIDCLIPNKQTINPYQYGNFQRIFECTNYHEEYSKFKLIEPATVFKNDNAVWILERKGKIKFI
jgi:hypothetical protein